MEAFYPPAHRRLLVVAAVTLAVEVLIARRTTTGVDALSSYVVLVAAGAALARWCRSSEQSPIFLSTGILVLVSTAVAVEFGLDPIGRFEHGPERWMVALRNGAARTLVTLPLGASVAWAAWHIAAVRGTRVGL